MEESHLSINYFCKLTVSKTKYVDDGHRLYMTAVMTVSYLLKETIWFRSIVAIMY